MTRFLSLFLALMVSCVFLSACGSDEEENIPTSQVDGQNDTTSTNPVEDDLPQDLPPVAPKDFGDAPQFQLADLNGNQISLADFQGQVVAINFWATWCGPCRREIPEFVAIQEKYQDKGFTILGITRDIEVQNGKVTKDEKAVQDFVEAFKVNYPVLWDVENVFGELYDGFGMPTTIILDREHKMRFRHNNIVDKVTFEAEIETLLKE
ncbi:TlpA family protein disulfide reductase [Candidatus Poribacteria bacterium]|nr:TlpA family protein disulfide reductase [Candidatus Poribacteria bacterium]